MTALRTAALVVNPTAGRGRAARLRPLVARRLGAAGIEVREVVGRDAAETLALTCAEVERGVDAVVALGGDGLVHLALQAVAGSPVALGIVPAGTGNDLAAALDLPTGAEAAVAVAAAGEVRVVDAVRATHAGGSEWFGCVLGAGFDSMVNERANRMRWPHGPRRYDLAIVAELRTFRPLPFVLTVDGERRETEAMLVAVGNGRSYGGGMRITPEAVVDDGLIDVTVVGPISKPALLRVFPTVYKGTHLAHPAVSTWRGREVTISSPGVVAYADGERVAPLPVTCTVVPGALRVLAPGGT